MSAAEKLILAALVTTIVAVIMIGFVCYLARLSKPPPDDPDYSDGV